MEYEKIDYSRYYVRNTAPYQDTAPSDGHEVEYIPREDKRRRRAHDKGQQSPRKSRKFLILLVSILLITGVTFLIADAVKGGYILDSIEHVFSGHNTPIATYYGVEMGTFEDMDSARVHANRLRKQEGAGYVLFDEGYRVLVHVYMSREDADSVAKKLRLTGENATVYPFEIAKIDYTLFPDSTRNIVKSSIAFNERVIRRLYEIAGELALGNIDENSAKMQVKGLNDETHNVIVEYEANVDNAISDVDVVKVKAELVSIESMLDNLSHDTVKRPNMLSDIRYTACLVVNSYRELASELSYK